MNVRTTRRAIAPVAIATGLALVLSACGGGGGTGAAEPEPSDAHSPGPLEKMWTEAYGDFTIDASNDQQRRMEQIVAECMSEQGWEYTPVEYPTMEEPIAEPMPVEGDGPQWGTEEYAKEFGYGIATYDLGEGDGAATMTAEPLPIDPGDGSGWTDPNQEYVESLSETAQQAYYEALNGPQPTEEELSSGDWQYDPANAGCYGKASEQIYGGVTDIWEDERFKGLIEEMNLIYSSVENDPKVAEAKSVWTSCMADAGYPGLADSSAAQETIYKELSAYWDKGEEPPAEVKKAVAEKERAIATADFGCSKKAKVDKVQLEATHQAEQDFIDAHKAELEELMAALKEQQDALNNG